MSDDGITKPIEWVEYPQAPPKVEGDGEPCPHCNKKLERLKAYRDDSGNLLITVSYKIPAAIVPSEVDGLCHLIQAFVYGLGGKPKPTRKTRPRRKKKGV